MDQVLEAALRRRPKPLEPKAVGPTGDGRPVPASSATVHRPTFPPTDQSPVVVQHADGAC